MILSGLKPLYKSMRSEEIERYQFRYSRNNVEFDIFFLIDTVPFQLMFGVLMENFCFWLDVEQGFRINPQLETEKYTRLCKILKLKYNPDNPFSPTAFFQEFNNRIPAVANKSQTLKPDKIAVYERDVEEADKIYFVGWRDNDKRKYNVRPENLEKTERLLSYPARLFCEQNNISSCWTDQKREVQEFSLKSLHKWYQQNSQNSENV